MVHGIFRDHAGALRPQRHHHYFGLALAHQLLGGGSYGLVV
ncbi:hypothetical protein N008_05080 [Hymenobacter sp. APR13]|nr:hypothetical protein N008_05080 [Hymenobacter sp. APR13]